MASEVKAWTVPVEDFSLFFFVVIEPLTTAFRLRRALVTWRLQRRGCTKQLIKVEAGRPQGAGAAGRCARRLRKSRVLYAGPSKPSARAPWSGLVRL